MASAVVLMGILFIFNQVDSTYITYWLGVILATSIIVVPTYIAVLAMIKYFFEPVSATYTIKKGRNYSNWYYRLRVFLKTQKPFTVEITLHKSCEVKTEGIQKIFGIGDFNHHLNSDRIGFRWDGMYYTIFSYKYMGTVRHEVALRKVSSEEKFSINFHEFQLSQYPRGKYLFPYFEQDGTEEEGAPQDMKITLTFK